MPNMSYCRFENTLRDLEDCYYALSRIYDEVSDMSKYEKNASIELVALCKSIAEEWTEDEVREVINNAKVEDNEE